MDRFTDIHKQAVKLLQELCTPSGILASLIEADNYKRIWARDSIVCGLAGILLRDEQIIEGLRSSLVTLSGAQHEQGMIPSNVDPEDPENASYGSLAGRIDTNTWFIIGVALYVRYTNDVDFLSEMEPAVESCREFLRSAEFNGKGWIYTPLSGNWADEYPVQGYTLYDNCLRIWAERLWHDITDEDSDISDLLVEKTRINYWPGDATDEKLIYHENGYNRARDLNRKHYFSQILPGYYDGRFDAAGNALALLLLDPDDQKRTETAEWFEQLGFEVGRPLVPAFWPVIDKNDRTWHFLENNYSYEFKNEPGKFHNGGIWPVWMGMYCMGLAAIGLHDKVEEIVEEFAALVEECTYWDFHEYIESNHFQFAGKVKMGYTAAGIVFMGIAKDDRGIIATQFTS